MIRLRQIELNVNDDSVNNLLLKCSKRININITDIKSYKIIKKSIDARKKPNLYYSYEIDIELSNEEKILLKNKSKDIFLSPTEKYIYPNKGTKELKYRPIIVGAGPCGLFCAYILAEQGYKPIIIERGEDVDNRIKSVEHFWKSGELNINSNVQFGEGGAGTFSDGKLNTLVKDKVYRQKKVFEIFVEHGAPEEILYENKPHIGTNLLRNIVKNIRKKIISMGGKFYFNTCLTNIKTKENNLTEIEINNNRIILTNILILAIGHSARDTFNMLYNKQILMLPKPFAVGIRIQHSQNMINKSQYGTEKPNLKAASYKLTYTSSTGRGVYTFCMCPGGYVVNSSSEEKHLVINGMSNYERDTENANSAIIVTVGPKDFGNNPMDGIKFQRTLEEKAYLEGKGKIPIQLYKDFKDNTLTTTLKNVKPIFKGDYSYGNINNILPKYIIESLIEGIDYFDKKIKGYGREDAILAAIESRTSSPIKIVRNDQFETNIKGIYPAGEGAGYAGGITSAAVDGIKVAESLIKTYNN